MGQDDLNDVHKLHHRAHNPVNADKGYSDPDAYMTQPSSIFVGLVQSFFEPETSVIRQVIRVQGKTAHRSAAWATYKSFQLALVYYLAGPDRFWEWLLASRVGNWFSMFVFHTLLHYDPIFKKGIQEWTGIPHLVDSASRVVFGHDITCHISNHGSHHSMSHLPAHMIPPPTAP
eukprot:CAMPEP_0118688336 /NCGR_PEP_ID=MMETSP0800-20121206/8864_1 /TAXON_ID=210618 ORGANISM="Striatella unipunctata, Strain CCMP2910" /NCGR_SAMPLE_ID=MMETSP0800 /ASSEMBLY_ACC=CAM_ASM_000638 /LENGTH=173 /DNA_ID=CAMNT_0006585585 /DNA_START=341 /DNA_END=862 /DNA_ORIENTATION=+